MNFGGPINWSIGKPTDNSPPPPPPPPAARVSAGLTPAASLVPDCAPSSLAAYFNGHSGLPGTYLPSPPHHLPPPPSTTPCRPLRASILSPVLDHIASSLGDFLRLPCLRVVYLDATVSFSVRTDPMDDITPLLLAPDPVPSIVKLFLLINLEAGSVLINQFESNSDCPSNKAVATNLEHPSPPPRVYALVSIYLIPSSATIPFSCYVHFRHNQRRQRKCLHLKNLMFMNIHSNYSIQLHALGLGQLDRTIAARVYLYRFLVQYI